MGDKVKAKSKFSPFDYFKELTNRNQSEMVFDDDFEKSYSPIMMNRIVASIPSYVDCASMMDLYFKSIPKEINYQFYNEVLPKTFIRVDYVSKKSDRKDFTELREAVSKYYEVGSKDAEVIIATLSDEQLEDIKDTVSMMQNV